MDTERIKRNVEKMLAMKAPEADIDQYLGSEGVTPDQLRSGPQQPSASMSYGDTAVDAAKSLGIGVVQGGVGLSTLPGNLESLGRAGINYGAEKLGFDPPVSSDPYFTTYGERKGNIEDAFETKFYEPKTKTGEYARTVGEFAPLAALGPGGWAVRTANVVAPAVVSETAGQMTKGTAAEPWARAAGGLAGGMLPAAVMRGVTPLPAHAAHTDAVNVLRQNGVNDLTAGQITGSRPLKYAESVTQDVPFSGGRATQMMERQGEQFTQAAMQRAGINAERATPPVVDQAFQRVGQVFDDLGTRNNVAIDGPLLNELQNIVDDYHYFVPATARAPVVEGVVNDVRTAVANNGAAAPLLPGDAYNALRSRMSRMASSTSADPQLSNALQRIRNAFDDAMERSVTPQDAAAFREARQQYGNLIRITQAMGGAGENAAKGLMSPAQLRNAVKTQDLRRYVRGQDDLGNLARAGEAVMKPLPQSGTAPRMAAQNAMNVLAALGGNSVAGVPGAVGAVALPGAISRTLMSRPVQGYLANQRAAPALTAYDAARVGPMAKIPQAASQLQGLVGTQTKGPDHDKKKAAKKGDR